MYNVKAGLKKVLCIVSLASLLSGFAPANSAKAINVPPGSVVINEIAWAGTAASSSDEWIELYNTTGSNIDLSGWLIDDDNGDQQYAIPNGVIAAHSYFLIEDAQETTNINADLVINLSLNNAGDKLSLNDADGNIIDVVNANGGAWYASDAAAKISMERIDAMNPNDAAVNWAANSAGNGATDQNGNLIKGTPRGINSASAHPQEASVNLAPDNAEPRRNDEIIVQVQTRGVQNLFSYGFDIIYDPEALEYMSAAKSSFLDEQGSFQTSFYAGLENNTVGKIVAAESRLAENKTGASGDGVLFSMRFRAVGAEGSSSNINVGQNSFLADPANDLIAEFSGAAVSVQITVTAPVQNLQAREGANRYSIYLSWAAPQDGADDYKILRKNAAGSYAEIGETNNLEFTDADPSAHGGRIIPDVIYEYQVIAVKNEIESLPTDAAQKETRGLKGDNNRSDRVDGRDLERLARRFAETSADAAFDPLVDTTYDGRIDGGDLIDIGANWALTYGAQ